MLEHRATKNRCLLDVCKVGQTVFNLGAISSLNQFQLQIHSSLYSNLARVIHVQFGQQNFPGTSNAAIKMSMFLNISRYFIRF